MYDDTVKPHAGLSLLDTPSYVILLVFVCFLILSGIFEHVRLLMHRLICPHACLKLTTCSDKGTLCESCDGLIAASEWSGHT